MIWKQNLVAGINTAISRRKDAVIAVHSAEQQVWGEHRLNVTFSTLHLFNLIKLSFKIICDNDQERIPVGTILEE